MRLSPWFWIGFCGVIVLGLSSMPGCGEEALLESPDPCVTEQDTVNECVRGGRPVSYKIGSEAPQTFFLYGEPEIEYCLEVTRQTGYITISHTTGTVTRDGNHFMWCVSPEDLFPEWMTVRSLTASAAFQLVVP